MQCERQSILYIYIFLTNLFQDVTLNVNVSDVVCGKPTGLHTFFIDNVLLLWKSAS